MTKLTGGSRFLIERVRLVDEDIAIEGRFDLPPLASLTAEDQVFVAAFVRCHGSIKQMEKFFGVSYPTIKNRLNRIGALLPFAEIDAWRSGARRAGPHQRPAVAPRARRNQRERCAEPSQESRGRS